MVMPVALMDKALNSGIFNVCIITSDEDVVCDTAADNDQVSDTDNVQPCVTAIHDWMKVCHILRRRLLTCIYQSCLNI